MNKRIKKKESPRHNEKISTVPHELLDKIKEAAMEYFEDVYETPVCNVRLLDGYDGEKIYVEIKDGVIKDEMSSPNYYGNVVAQHVLKTFPELEFVGFDCYYDVELQFKIRNK